MRSIDASDTEGVIACALLGSATTASYSYTWNKIPVGIYTIAITANAIDATGVISATSAANSISAIRSRGQV